VIKVSFTSPDSVTWNEYPNFFNRSAAERIDGVLMSRVEIFSTVPDFIARNVAAGEIIFWILGVGVDIITIFVNCFILYC